MQSSNLKIHKQSKHEGTIFACKECDNDYIATTAWNLKVHTKTKHERIIYQCDQCDFKTPWNSRVKAHKKAKHE